MLEFVTSVQYLYDIGNYFSMFSGMVLITDAKITPFVGFAIK